MNKDFTQTTEYDKARGLIYGERSYMSICLHHAYNGNLATLRKCFDDTRKGFGPGTASQLEGVFPNGDGIYMAGCTPLLAACMGLKGDTVRFLLTFPETDLKALVRSWDGKKIFTAEYLVWTHRHSMPLKYVTPIMRMLADTGKIDLDRVYYNSTLLGMDLVTDRMDKALFLLSIGAKKVGPVYDFGDTCRGRYVRCIMPRVSLISLVAASVTKEREGDPWFSVGFLRGVFEAIIDDRVWSHYQQ